MPSSTLPATRPAPPPEDCEYSVPTWKDVPSTWDVFFSLRCPYRSPENPVAAYLWRKRVWFEVTFALSMMEPWEKLLLVLVLTSVSLLISYAATTYLPLHVHFLLSRAKYYLLGTDLPISVSTSTTVPVDGGVYGLGVIGDYAYGGIEKLGEFVSTWTVWNATTGAAQ